VGSGIGSFVSVPAAAITVAAVAPATTTNGVDGDAAAYIAAVESADGQSLEEGVKSAINSFVLGCKADGIWTAIKASCILAGARTLTGALVPLVGPAPTNVGGLFVSGDYDRETGLVGDGSTKYLNSNYAYPTALQNNCHATVYASSVPSTGRTLISYADASGQGTLFWNDLVRAYAAAGDDYTPASTASGFNGIARASSTAFTYRRAGSNVTDTQNSVNVTHQALGVFARRRDTGAYDNHSNARLAFYSIGESLDLALLDTRVTALINAIAAAIP
jgi:hypothetical protein